MADVKNVLLQIGPGNTSTTRDVTVSYDLEFSPTEAGETYRLEIELHADDTQPNDEEKPSFLKKTLLYRFPFFLSQYKFITAQAGAQSFTDSRMVQVQRLNEDPGTDVFRLDPFNRFEIPHVDEVVARVHLSQFVGEEKSPIVSGIYG